MEAHWVFFVFMSGGSENVKRGTSPGEDGVDAVFRVDAHIGVVVCSGVDAGNMQFMCWSGCK